MIEQPEIFYLKELLKELDAKNRDSVYPDPNRRDALEWAIDQLEWRGMDSAPEFDVVLVLMQSKAGKLFTSLMMNEHGAWRTDSGFQFNGIAKMIGWRPSPAVPEVCDE